MPTNAPEVFPIKIEGDTSALDAMKGKLREAEGDLKRLQYTAKSELFGELQFAKAKAQVKDLSSEIKGLDRANREAERSAAKTAKEAQKLAEIRNAAKRPSSLLEGSGGEMSAKGADAGSLFGSAFAGTFAGNLASHAAVAIKDLAVSIPSMIGEGVIEGVKATSTKIRNIAILDRLTKGQGEIAEQVSKSLAGETGIGEDKAMERVKALIQAKFDRGDTELVFKASAEIGAVKGEGKADAFLAILEKVQLEGKVTEKALKGLAGAGVEKSALLEQLKQTGETTEQVEARLKAGGVAAKDFARAAATAVQNDIGGVAGKGLDAMINKLKIGVGDLFDGMDEGVSVIEGVGETIGKALSGAEGAQLKASISAAGNEVLALAKNITAADIKTLFSAAAGAATTLASGIKEAAGAAAALYNFAKQVSGSGSHMESGSSGTAEGDAIEQEIAAGNRRAFIREQAIEKAKADAKRLEEATAGNAKGDAAAGGVQTGKAYADGLAKGIEENAGKPAAAAAAAMAGTIDAGKATAKIKSPSKVTEEEGKNLEEGRALGIQRNAWRPAAAAADSMGRTVNAGGATGGALGGSGGSAGGNNYTFAPVITIPGGSDVGAAIDRALTLAYPAFLSMLRQSERDKREGFTNARG
mgnify:FL=1